VLPFALLTLLIFLFEGMGAWEMQKEGSELFPYVAEQY
jgi:Na+-transporting methylmalonyl-CoA/oxaloacetate decarboxylase gamma subunit